MKCYKCGGHTKLISSKSLYSGRVKKNVYACMMCGERVKTREAMDYEKWLALKRERAEEAAKKGEIAEYCSGDNCLTCKYTVCMEDRRDHTSAERRTG